MKDWLIGHCGAPVTAKGNTLDAFKAARTYPLGWVELDIHTTKDNIVVCHHEFDINGLDIATNNYSDLKIQDPKLTTFEEAIKAVGNIPLIVEIKPVGTAKNVIKKLKNHPEWYIASFKPEVINELINLGINKQRLYLLHYWYYFNFLSIRKTLNLGVAGIGVKYWVLTPRIYYRATYNNLEIYTYTVNSPWLAKLFKKYYPKMKICTNRPDLLQKID